MGIKVQFNPSTGKVSYTAGTGKVQVFDEDAVVACQYCVSTPLNLNVTFDNVVIADGCGTCNLGLPKDYKFTNIPDINQTFTLTQSLTVPCLWQKVINLDPSATFDFYASSDETCTGRQGGAVSPVLTIDVTRAAGGVAQVRALFTVGAVGAMFSSVLYTPTSRCVEISNEANIYTDSSCFAGVGGTATVVEI